MPRNNPRRPPVKANNSMTVEFLRRTIGKWSPESNSTKVKKTSNFRATWSFELKANFLNESRKAEKNSRWATHKIVKCTHSWDLIPTMVSSILVSCGVTIIIITSGWLKKNFWLSLFGNSYGLWTITRQGLPFNWWSEFVLFIPKWKMFPSSRDVVLNGVASLSNGRSSMFSPLKSILKIRSASTLFLKNSPRSQKLTVLQRPNSVVIS